MTKEEKNLLLKDLCSRLPYGVMVDITYSKEHGSSDRLRICSEGCLTLNTDLLGLYVEDEIYLKPYLRPMRDMTDKEWEMIHEIDKKRMIFSARHLTYHIDGEIIDVFNKRNIDWRGLIEKGLAIEAPEDMYK